MKKGGLRRRAAWAGVCAALALALATGGTFAWLSKQQPSDGTYVALSGFEVTGALSFGDRAYDGKSVMAPVSFDPGAENYIGKLNYTVTYSGASPAYLRVRVLEQWVDPATDEILSAGYLPYHVTGQAALKNDPDAASLPAGGGDAHAALAETGAWVDHRSTDYCYYYSVPVQPSQIAVSTVQGDETAVTAIGDGTVELTLIDQLSDPEGTAAMVAGIDPAHTELSLILEVEAVQPNRFREFWGIDAIPSPG